MDYIFYKPEKINKKFYTEVYMSFAPIDQPIDLLQSCQVLADSWI